MLECVWSSESACGRRDHNEDSLLAAPPIFAVADGMGGHAAGDVASKIAVTALSRLGGRSAAGQSMLALALDEANREITAAAQGNPAMQGMGTTVAGISLGQCTADGVAAVAFCVGDSRVYHWRDGQLIRVTRDHSIVQELVDAGQIPAAQAAHHPGRNVVTRALGVRGSAVPDFYPVSVRSADRFVICSDGLTSELGDDEIAAVLAGRPSAEAAVQTLVRAALERGGRDNVSVIVVEMTEAPGGREVDEDVVTTPRSAQVAMDTVDRDIGSAGRDAGGAT